MSRDCEACGSLTPEIEPGNCHCEDCSGDNDGWKWSDETEAAIIGFGKGFFDNGTLNAGDTIVWGSAMSVKVSDNDFPILVKAMRYYGHTGYLAFVALRCGHNIMPEFFMKEYDNDHPPITRKTYRAAKDYIRQLAKEHNEKITAMYKKWGKDEVPKEMIYKLHRPEEDLE